MSDVRETPVELGFDVGTTTGWGLIGYHVALGLMREGWRVRIDPPWSGIPRVLVPNFVTALNVQDSGEYRIRIDAYGNHCPKFVEIPNRFRVVFCVCEDTAFTDDGVRALREYDLVLAPSTWAKGILDDYGIESTVWHQGYDESLFFPTPRLRSDDRFYVFSGGKLEFRKGQDIVVEAFKRFRETPEGKDAVLVTAWHNPWPATMEGIYESGYVRGLPKIQNGRLDIASWLEQNGIPRHAHIDLGQVTQPDLAQAIRECDVALFPNRCEAATNMMLPEVLACGVPAIISNCCGQRDITAGVEDDALVGVYAMETTPVALSCPLYRGMKGWGETDPDACVRGLLFYARHGYTEPYEIADVTRHRFGWQGRVIDLSDILATSESLAVAMDRVKV